MASERKPIYENGWLTTIIFIALQVFGLTHFSGWWILVTLCLPEVAWVFFIVWLIAQFLVV